MQKKDEEEQKKMKKRQIYMAALAAVVIVPLIALAQGYSGLIAPQSNYKPDAGGKNDGYAGLIAPTPGIKKYSDPVQRNDLHGFIENSAPKTAESARKNTLDNIRASKQAQIDAQKARSAAALKQQNEAVQARLEEQRKKQEEEAAERAAAQQQGQVP